MRRPRIAVAVAAALLAAAATSVTSAVAGHASDARVADARARERTLEGEIGSLTAQIRSFERRAGDVSTRLGALERDLELHRRRLARIGTLLQLQRQQLGVLRAETAVARRRLDRRLVQLYVGGGGPSAVEVVLGARSLDDALRRLDALDAVARQDVAIVDAVRAGRARVRAARSRTIQLRRSVAGSMRVVAYRAEQARALRNSLVTRGRTLAGVRRRTLDTLAATRAQERQWIDEAAALERSDGQVSAAIAGQPSAGSSPPSSAGLIWPISGTITSPYGLRWGKLHPGLDIAAPTGTPIRAAAGGRVILAGYSGGYGYLVVIDHGNGIVTAYAHQSRLAASTGQQVAQGDVIGYVGSTGFSTGPHVHFEVRVNGSPVDPMGYL